MEMIGEDRPHIDQEERRSGPLWAVVGAALGATLGLVLVGSATGFYAGLLIGALLEAFVEVCLPHARPWPAAAGLPVIVAGLAVGAGVGAFAGLLPRPPDGLRLLDLAVGGALIGGLTAFVDRVLVWVLFPAGAAKASGAAEDEPDEDDLPGVEDHW